MVQMTYKGQDFKTAPYAFQYFIQVHVNVLGASKGTSLGQTVQIYDLRPCV